MFEKLPSKNKNIIAYKVIDYIHDKDYKTLIPEVKAAVKDLDEVNFLFDLSEFKFITPKGEYDDLNFIKEFTPKKIAFIGNETWEKVIPVFYKIFSRAEFKYFKEAEKDQAWKWLEE